MPTSNRLLLRTIGRYLRRKRKDRGMSTGELACRLQNELSGEAVEEKRAILARAFAQVLREHRERRGLSLDQLAKKARTDRQYLEGLENGTQRIYIDAAILIARALNVSAANFLAEAWNRQEHLTN